VRFVELEEAKAARGLRLVVVGAVPSPWSQGAMGLFDLAGIDYLAVRFHRRTRTFGAGRARTTRPAVFFDDEPPRTGWAEILALAARQGRSAALVPADDEARMRTFGLGHELLGEDGLAWSVRLLLIHAGFTTNGERGWPVPVARYLAPKYGYAPDARRLPPASVRSACSELLGRTLEAARAAGHDYFFGAAPTALDVYSAVVLG
jgi:hypothetical protein